MLKRWYSNLSLRTKISAIALGIMVLSVVAVATTSLFQIRNQIAAEEFRSADSAALGIARASELALSVGDTRELARLTASFLRADNILFIAVYGNSDDPMASALRDQRTWDQYRGGHVDSRYCIVAERRVEASAGGDEFSNEVQIDSSAPTPATTKSGVPRLIGRVVVGLSTAPAIEAQQRENRLTLGATIVAAIVGAVVLFLTLGQWMRRLQKLSDASRAISDGNFSGAIEDQHDDEIGRLGQSFDDMRLALRKRDQKLNLFTETLQEKVNDRTRDLEAARNAAEEASRAKSLFLANMSHELRTPLNGVIGMVNLLLSTEPNAQQRRYCDIAKASGHSLLELINDILDFSKIEAGKLDLDTIDFDMFEVIESVIQMLGERAEKKQIELLCSIAKDVPRKVNGDPVRLRQVILNLLSNAIKFTEAGEVVVTAALEKQTYSNAMVKFSVRDSGIGIPPDRLGKLFKSFSQVDTSTTRKFGGTGLGLAISQRIVGLMGGTIGVESEQGKGSTFWFIAEFMKRPTPRAASVEKKYDPRGLRILAVDDNQTNREILSMQLRSWSFRAEVAASAEQAIEMLKAAATARDPYRLAILDIHMPNTDGFQLAQTIKTNPVNRDLMLISLGSISERQEAEKMKQLGFSASLTKPVLSSQLYNAIVDSLAAREQGTASSNPSISMANNSARLNGVSVLLAEDNEINQLVACELLEQAGCRCTVVADGRLAVDAALGNEFDVILMDCQMPELDGLEATRLIRQAEKSAREPKHRPIIALTANAIKGDREKCLAAGMDGYVTKPIEPLELFRTIRSFLPSARAVDSSSLDIPPGPTSETVPAAASIAVVSPPVDLLSLRNRCMGNQTLAAKALGKFDEIITREVEVLALSIQQKDSKGVAASAHKIKGAAANVSADRVRNVAAEIETLGISDTLAESQSCLDRLDREMRDFREYLSTALDQLSRSAKPVEPQNPIKPQVQT